MYVDKEVELILLLYEMVLFTKTACVVLVSTLLNLAYGAPTTIHDDQCFDVKDCSGFEQATTCCGEYEAFSKANCRRHCNFCSPTVTPKPNCMDKIPNCKDYNNDLCVNKAFEGFVESNCAGFCKLCEKPVFKPSCAGNETNVVFTTPVHTTPSTTPGTTTIPKDKCSSEGIYYATFETWYTLDCQLSCTCIDGVNNSTRCEPVRCPIWIHNCDLTYKEGACCPILKCNYFNTVHGPAHIQN